MPTFKYEGKKTIEYWGEIEADDPAQAEMKLLAMELDIETENHGVSLDSEHTLMDADYNEIDVDEWAYQQRKAKREAGNGEQA